MRRFIFGLLALLTCGQIHAADIFWDNTTGAGPFSFGDPNNWNPAQVPTTGDNAIFDNAGAVPFSVTFAGAETSDRLIFNDDDVTFDFNGNSYALTDASSAAPSIVIGEVTGDDGVLTLTDGTLSGVYMALGLTDGSGNVEVTTDGVLSLTQSLTVGGSTTMAGGTGVFSIENNGDVDVTGTLKVWGNGTYTQNGGTVTVGSFDYSAVGSIFIFNDGTLRVEGGVFDNGSADLNIDGTDPNHLPTLQIVGGAMANILNSKFGVSQQGALSIQSGGDVTSTVISIGDVFGSNGSVTVEDPNSMLTISIGLGVGNGGTGSLTIQNGGAVSVNNVASIADNSGSNGSATVADPNSTWTITGTFRVANGGMGSLTIQNGGAVSAVDANIGRLASSNGTVTVEDPNSTWTSSGSLYVGGDDVAAGGSGTLTVKNGGQVTVTNTLKVYSGNTVNLGDPNNPGEALPKITTGVLDVVDPNDFVWTAGTVEITNSQVYIDPTVGPNPFGDSLTVGNGKVLRTTSATGDITVGRDGIGMLTISTGGTVSSAGGTSDFFLGRATGGNGTVMVDGGNLDVDDVMVVGTASGSSGDIQVTNGGSVTVGNDTNIANSSGSIGSVTVSDPNSTWTNTGSVYVGGNALLAGGIGTLTVNSGGTVDVAGTLKVWNTSDPNSSTFVELDGGTIVTGTLELVEAGVCDLNSTCDFRWGTGTLKINNSNVVIQTGIGSFSSPLTVGTGQTLNVDNNFFDLVVGATGGGTLFVANDPNDPNMPGGTVEVDDFTIGGSSDGDVFGTSAGNGLVFVFGNTSSITVRDDAMYVGNEGTGTLVISTGGKVHVQNFDNFVDTHVARLSGSNGTVTIDTTDPNAPTSTWDIDNSLFIGNDLGGGGAGTVNVQLGGLLDVTEVSEAIQVEDNGTLNLTGGEVRMRQLTISGGTLSFTSGTLHDIDSLTFTSSDSLEPARDLTSNKTLQVDNTTTVSGTTLTIAGGTLTTSALVTTAGGAVDFNSGTVNITGASGVTVGSAGPFGTVFTLGFNSALNVTNTTTVQNDGIFSLDGGSLTTNVLDTSSGGQFVWSKGSLTLTGVATTMNLTVPSLGQLSATGVVTGQITALGGSTITATGSLSLGDASDASGFYSNGTVNVNDNTLTLNDSNDAVFDSGAAVALGSAGTGILQAANGLTLDFGGNMSGFGTVDTPNSAATPLINNGNITGNDPNAPITLAGYVKGVGTLDNVNITGTDAPGFSTAAVNRGSVSYNGTLEIEIGGTTPGSDYDQLNHILGAGIADLGGTLDVQLIGGFNPSFADTFDIITATAVEGTFDLEMLPTLTGALQWIVDYQSNAVSLLVVLAGDFDFNGEVNGFDFLSWQRGESPNPLSQSDLADWEANYGAVAPLSAASTAVPEPATCIMLMLGMLGMFRRTSP